MKLLHSRSARAIVVALAAGSLALTGCSSDSDKGGKANGAANKDDAKKQSEQITFGTAKESQGPAEPVPGAKPGGTIVSYQEADFSHWDPGQIYVSDAGLMATILHRGLTANKETIDGKKMIVGDIATDTGTTEDGGKTWKYTLKDGIKDENGNAITSKDIRHTFERLAAKFITDGPTYVQGWLGGSPDEYRKLLPDGPYKGKHLPASILETPDDKTVIFHLKTAQPDFPYALAMAGYSVVPEKADTKEKYDQKPVALGPYKFGEYKPGKELTLVKNTNWDAASDPVRRQQVESWKFEIGPTVSDQTKTLLADRGEAKNAIQALGAVDTTLVKDVVTNKAAMARTIQGFQPYVWQLNFNMEKLKDKRIRDAITYAVPNQNFLMQDGGNYGGEVAGGLLAPTLPGFEKDFDPFGKLKKPNGDPEKARALLKEAGAEGMELLYAYSNTEIRQKQAVVLVAALEKAGFKVKKKELDGATWYEQVGKVSRPYDIFMTGWGQDWPSPSTVIPPVYDGTVIADGASNYSHINDPHVNAEIKRISAITDPVKASKEWNTLHHYIVEKVNPAAPIYYTKQLQISGSNVGGLHYSTFTSYIDLNRLFLKS
ncbi:ABC transporter substrate-binding protein [Streptomyces polyrhachis]|uniref:ABC transporter substrate-binding protein n=1 Tax=Streptomyces polyrhachis TaxID=1282885 RepID=A0ABW2GJX8_9ACTN